MEESREQLRKRGLGLAAISYDSVAVLKHFADRKAIKFPLLSDAESKVIRDFGLLNEEAPKNTPFFGVPHPVTYIVDSRGVVKSRHFEEDYRKRYTTGNILTQQLNIRTGAVSTTVKNPRISVTASSSNAIVRAGERIRLILDVQLPPKMHVYAPGVQGYIPIEWKLNDGPAFEALNFGYPQSKTLHLPAIKETAPVYEKAFSLQREVVIAQPAKLKPLLSDSTFVIEGSFRYQACDDKKCYIPETIPLKWTLRFEPHDSQRVPQELQRKPIAPQKADILRGVFFSMRRYIEIYAGPGKPPRREPAARDCGLDRCEPRAHLHSDGSNRHRLAIVATTDYPDSQACDT